MCLFDYVILCSCIYPCRFLFMCSMGLSYFVGFLIFLCSTFRSVFLSDVGFHSFMYLLCMFVGVRASHINQR